MSRPVISPKDWHRLERGFQRDAADPDNLVVPGQKSQAVHPPVQRGAAANRQPTSLLPMRCGAEIGLAGVRLLPTSIIGGGLARGIRYSLCEQGCQLKPGTVDCHVRCRSVPDALAIAVPPIAAAGNDGFVVQPTASTAISHDRRVDECEGTEVAIMPAMVEEHGARRLHMDSRGAHVKRMRLHPCIGRALTSTCDQHDAAQNTCSYQRRRGSIRHLGLSFGTFSPLLHVVHRILDAAVLYLI